MPLPAWQVEQSWSVAATLTHRLFGIFRVPLGPPGGPTELVDTKDAAIDSAWRFEVVAAPDDPAAPGRVTLDLCCTSDRESPFHGQAYRLHLRRDRLDGDGDDAGAGLGLESVWSLTLPEPPPPDAPPPEDPRAAWLAEVAARRVGTIVLQADPARPCFEPGERYGLLFDLARLEDPFRPTPAPEELELPAGACLEERALLPDGRRRYTWSRSFPAGPTARARQVWGDGPWYDLHERELVLPGDGGEEVILVARITRVS